MGSLINKPHVVLLPFPAQGHVNPFMQLAKLLHSRGFHITFVNNEFNRQRYLKSKGSEYLEGLPDFKFETITDGLPPSDPDATQDIASLSDRARKDMIVPFRELLKKLNSTPDLPPVSCVISDAFLIFGVKAARELGILGIPLWTASGCGLLVYLHYPELRKRGLFPCKDENFNTDGTLDTPIDWIPGVKDFRLRDLPMPCRSTNPNEILWNCLKDETIDCLSCPAMMVNTFEEFEHEAMEVVKTIYPNIYNIGPLTLLEKSLSQSQAKTLNPSLWKQDTKCLEWLDKQKPNSVVYVNYGSIAVLSEQHFREFAWGLADSNYPFLWVVRPDIVKANSATLTEEYYEVIKDRGLLAPWCPQEQVLAHKSVGVYLSHSGWNSTLETICAGVPVICYPLFAEQTTNARFSCTVWGIGVELDQDVKREQLTRLVKEVLESENGKKMKRRAVEWKKKAEEATSVGGSSYNDFNRLFQEVLHFGN
ncbi:7-deoxyloganetin glucosyltransferase-like [Tripterygium wilfordii]|uniref:Glycosyltransferase n=1 Tax=Tripterygium wilfordii TaxID=458696 RepID=A0A7J7DTZ6_TRIWF|nr:linamarin synthase 2-like [Tripterygium wilfordii]KAF5749787.1 7-deoxyloganetin glucosyltransferase-like [Tripterygium wilfordii]